MPKLNMATTEQWLKMWEDGFHHQHDDREKGGSEHAASEGKGDGEKKKASGPGHHGTSVDKHLLKHVSSLTEDKDNLSIFVTLCGNSPDLAWLCNKGYDVVGCELSAKAVEQLFENRVLGAKIDYDVKDVGGGIKLYSATDGKKLKVYVGDFFASGLTPELTGTFDCVWDCHAIISVPAPLHTQYAEKVIKFLKPDGKMLFSTIDCKEPPKGIVPVPISTGRLSELFPSYSVEVLEDLESPWHSNKLGGKWTNPIALLTHKK